MISVRVPATSANLGPGYDTLGMALNLWLAAEWRAYPTTAIRIFGEGAELLPSDRSNLIYQVMADTYAELCGRALPDGELLVTSEIPVARGLGSSAAAVVAAVKLAFMLAERDLTPEECLARTTAIEHHADNVAAAIAGGATLVFTADAVPRYRRFDPPPFPVVLAIPNYPVSTDVARGILPSMVPREDAVFNAQRVGLWIYALARNDWNVLRWAGQDRLHQAARSAILPGFSAVIERMEGDGVPFVALSGSGSTVLALAEPGREDHVAAAMRETFAEVGVSARTLVTTASPVGALTTAPVSC